MNIFKAFGHTNKRVFPESTLTYSPKDVQEIFRVISGKLYTKGCIYRREYNENGELSQALAILDCCNSKQKRLYMEVCRRLSEMAEDEEFSEILSRGSCYGYTVDYCGKPDFSVMRDISPCNFPYFLAVAMKSRNGYCRQEALRYAGDYPMLLPHITAALNDRVKQVRQEAAAAFGKALPNMPGVSRYTAFEAMLSAKWAFIRVNRGGRYDRNAAGNAERALDSCISRELDSGTAKYCTGFKGRKLVAGSLDSAKRAKVYVTLIKQGIMTADTAREIIRCDTWVRAAVSNAASAYLDLPYDMLESLADCPYSIAARNAVTRLFERRGIWKGSEKYLMSSFASVRETAVYYWRQEAGGRNVSFRRVNRGTLQTFMNITRHGCRKRRRSGG